MIHQQHDVFSTKLKEASWKCYIPYVAIYMLFWKKEKIIKTKLKSVVCRGCGYVEVPHYIDGQDKFLEWWEYCKNSLWLWLYSVYNCQIQQTAQLNRQFLLCINYTSIKNKQQQQQKSQHDNALGFIYLSCNCQKCVRK